MEDNGREAMSGYLLNMVEYIRPKTERCQVFDNLSDELRQDLLAY